MAREPTYGTAGGQEVHAQTRHYLPALLRVGPRQIKRDLEATETFNAKVAVLLTRVVGTMWCFWVFSLMALCSLPSVLSAFSPFAHVFPAWMVKVSIIALVAWVAQTFLQLVLLPALMVGQNLQNVAADARAAKTFEDIEKVKTDMVTALDALNTQTAGGLKDVLDAIQKLAPRSA
jgi:hypothetical protein